MDRNAIIKEINNVIQEKGFGIKINNNTIDKTFKELGADSLQLLEMVMAVEEKFSITLPDEELSKIKTAHQLIDTILKTMK